MTFKTLGIAVLMLLALAGRASAANTWFASPTGAGTTCTQMAPCSVQEALTTNPALAPGDTVVLAGGTYPVTATLEVTKKISIEGKAGDPTPVLAGASSAHETLFWRPAAAPGIAAHISGIEVTIESSGLGGQALIVQNADPDLVTVERVRAEGNGRKAVGIELSDNPNILLRDSLAVSTGTSGVALALNGGGTDKPDLRNVTAIARQSDSVGISFFPLVASTVAPAPRVTSCEDLTVTMTNTIARGVDAASDIVANNAPADNRTCDSIVGSSHSNWRDKSGGSAAKVTSSDDQHSVDPVFVNESAGDFHEAAASPTIDAGIADPLNGLTDLDGTPRNLSAAPDIGAYESPFSAPPVGGGGSPPPDTTAPVGSPIAFTPTAFAPDKKGASIAAKRRVKRGSRVSFTLSEPATVTFTVKRPVKGRRSGKRCVTGKRAKHLKGRGCTKLRTVNGSFTFTGQTGAGGFHFTGRLGNRALRPGRYLLIGVARDGAGNVSKQFRGSFKIVRG